MRKLCVMIGTCLAINISNGQNPLNETALPSIGITIQEGPGATNTQNWTYPYGTKLSVSGQVNGGYRTWQLMNKDRTVNSPLLYRIYEPNINNWQPWNELLFINANGKVGVGTTNPSETVDIAESGFRLGKTSFNNSAQAYLNLYEGVASHGARLFLDGAANTFTIKTRLSNVDKDILTIPYAGTHAGNVGIGTISPIEKLEVYNGNFVLGGPHKKFIFHTQFWTNSSDRLIIAPQNNGQWDWDKSFIINDNGNVGIGTGKVEGYRLSVEGKIRSREVEVNALQWADFVFEKDYELLSLSSVEAYVKKNKHLPNVPSEKEVKERGINLGEMDAILLRKIEELTLYVIELEKQIKKQ